MFGIDDAVIGAGIQAGSSLLGGLFSKSNNHAGRDQRQATSYANYSAVADKVRAAKDLGISPLYALGAPTISASSAVGSPSGSAMPEALRQAGQDVGRAVAATQTDIERKAALAQLEGLNLDNDLKRAQIAESARRIAGMPSVPVPHPLGFPGADDPRSIGGSDVGKMADDVMSPQRTSHGDIGVSYEANPYFMDAQTFENLYGSGPLEWLYGLALKGPADAYWNLPGPRIARRKKYYYDRIMPEGSYGRYNAN